MEGSWVQRFEPKDSSQRPTSINNSGSNTKENVDFGMPSDFGAVLTDFLEKQSEAAGTGMIPDVFLRRYVSGLSSGLSALSDQYRFDEAQVHLVSTVPGDYISGLPRKGHRDATYKPRVAYGPQRVSFILSRILNDCHIRSGKAARAAATSRLGSSRMEAGMPWFPPTLVSANERLVIQPTSIGANWTRDDLEVIVQSYLQPCSKDPSNKVITGQDQDCPLDLMDIVWPSMNDFDTMRRRRSAICKRTPEAAASITKQLTSTKDKNERGEHVFLSSVSFSKLDRSCISRMALFTRPPNVMPYESASIHFKSVCRLLQLNEEEPAANSKKTYSKQSKQPSTSSKEYLS
mmetsp:Transcript_26656/g.57311  ORF Transcript_26656/g.57311 Transcript_26656/m.57311 type:complete len:347 (-) Transcript_26656:1429-2469(-)|eukprot:CAMPEP_0172317556 /NCGR_PEP_ID=MMETSP1058-20130122/31990_1 /TAXON_ID=83371 /ORGANISM="Detonula confervacea, Strain CCMP 353" /LENGTH=346 /DNA_ID=CAMNT_0013032143 /DNA_START=191 /DNA_END=1227 /DNA_ORIENTATION=-